MKLLYGTGNPAKLSSMQRRLEKLDIELIGLKDMAEMGYKIPDVAEDGNTPLENARQKATAYYVGLAKKYGNLMAKYKNAICFVMDESHIYCAIYSLYRAIHSNPLVFPK